MLKLRGINICPTGIGAILTGAFDDLMSEYVCVVDRRDGRDEMLVRIEARGDTGRATEAYQALLRTRLGGDVVVQLAAPGGLSALIGIEARQKPIRLIDRPQ